MHPAGPTNSDLPLLAAGVSGKEGAIGGASSSSSASLPSAASSAVGIEESGLGGAGGSEDTWPLVLLRVSKIKAKSSAQVCVCVCVEPPRTATGGAHDASGEPSR